jgi:hypothetical protein
MAVNNKPAKQIFWGNILVIICCAFYLAWWILAFNPAGAKEGMETGWLLIPAFAAGLAGIILAVSGMRTSRAGAALFPKGVLLWGGIAAYFILWAVTGLLFKRQVTVELFLIVGWAVLALSELNALYGTGQFTHRLAIVFTVVVGAATVLSLVCYVLYYALGDWAGYIVGMVPLLSEALVMAGISVAMVVKKRREI